MKRLRNTDCSDLFERELQSLGYRLIAGVDEVGRGALAGPVVAASVVLDMEKIPQGLDDSKKLTKRQRESLVDKLEQSALAISVAAVDAQLIDKLNIHKASLKAMAEAVRGLKIRPDYLLIDGFALKGFEIPHRAIIKGDALSVSIAAASIVAKVTRDRMFAKYELVWPGYGFARNVGYGTSEHLAAIAKLGTTPIHRMTFQGVRPSSQMAFCFDNRD